MKNMRLSSRQARFLIHGFQGWMTEKKISEGHSEKEALRLPTRERIDEMKDWVAMGMPLKFNS